MTLLRRVALLLAVEGVALLVLGVAYGVASLTDDSDRAVAETAAALTVVFGAALLVLARALDQGKGWSRAPAVVLNAFAVPTGLSALQAGAWFVAVPVLALAGTVLYLLLNPATREALGR